MSLSKIQLEFLIEEVVLPFEALILEDESVSYFLKDENSASVHNLAIAKLTVAMYNNLDKAKSIIEKGVEAHKEHSVDVEYLKEYYTLYFKLCFEWNKKYIKNSEDFDKNIISIQNYVFEAFAKEGDSHESFFDFDSDKVRSDIDRMHYKDEQKISALEMFEQELITTEDTADILESAQDVEYLVLDEDIKYDMEYFEKLSGYIQIYASMFEKSLEFKDIGFSLRALVGFFEDHRETICDQKNVSSVGIVLKSIVEDLVFWTKAVLIEKNAIDIHYVDASLLANITQFQIMFGSDNQEGIEDQELELF